MNFILNITNTNKSVSMLLWNYDTSLFGTPCILVVQQLKTKSRRLKFSFFFLQITMKYLKYIIVANEDTCDLINMESYKFKIFLYTSYKNYANL